MKNLIILFLAFAFSNLAYSQTVPQDGETYTLCKYPSVSSFKLDSAVSWSYKAFGTQTVITLSGDSILVTNSDTTTIIGTDSSFLSNAPGWINLLFVTGI